ncbi:hypothetical protein AnigIFM59636_000716 [Aspergillus niger]|uniref:Uncharacterized protein n=3 Tax=Aspergillus niger TaxID=5061 RepID=A2QML0_ASPNC|nr:uncharacterized protein BO96DRAFT_452370 [Aspergillus niger CBS 101883]XP_059600878.1 hypothetical protein An07g02490 [Aspergillus niger]RDH16579.1 hypothetical protein M747DRAFT_308907 [Aspergillus niger ATCC 13496]PYH62572.1 hypothetical protein BO96DRAFT_452370 [Aspergillus niger CBS 101883]CAK39338.1 hypothetical protein An07g02490 [Aspergillus niger]GJP92641.1 uncharacterized protein AlacWU_05540 [Aspergillus niger]GKZ97335.1 hypothetical protein AnigIFM59636_000716 [Aspergillus niger
MRLLAALSLPAFMASLTAAQSTSVEHTLLFPLANFHGSDGTAVINIGGCITLPGDAPIGSVRVASDETCTLYPYDCAPVRFQFINQLTKVRNNYCQGDTSQAISANVAQFPDSQTWIGITCSFGSPDSSDGFGP